MECLQPVLYLAALSLAGCSGDGSNGGAVVDRRQMTAVVPTASIDAPEMSRGNSLSGPVSGDAFPAGTDDIFAVTDYRSTDKPTSNPAFDYGVAYFHNQAVSIDAGNKISFNTPQFYPVTGNLYFYAYSPVMSTAPSPSDDGYRQGSTGTAPMVTFDIGKGNVDILWARHDDGIARAATSTTQQHPRFDFSHRLQQVRIRLVRGVDFPPGWKVGAIYVKGNPRDDKDDANKLKDKATLNLLDGSVAYASKIDNFTHELKSPNLWDITIPVETNFLIRPIQRLSLTFMVDTDPSNPGQHTRTYSADVTLANTQTDVGGRSYLLTATFGGGIDVKVQMAGNGSWNSCTLKKQTIR